MFFSSKKLNQNATEIKKSILHIPTKMLPLQLG